MIRKKIFKKIKFQIGKKYKKDNLYGSGNAGLKIYKRIKSILSTKMIGKSKLIAVIPAKKNSSRLKKKNLQKLGRYSLVEKAILYAKSLNEVDKVIVSTDCKKIYKIAKKYEFNEKKLRDKKLSRKVFTHLR